MNQYKKIAVILACTLALTGCGGKSKSKIPAENLIRSSSSSKPAQTAPTPAQGGSGTDSKPLSGKNFVLPDSGQGLYLDDKFHFTVNGISLYIPCTQEDYEATGLWEKMSEDSLDMEKYEEVKNGVGIYANPDCDIDDINILTKARKIDDEVEFDEVFLKKGLDKEKAALNINGVELIIGETTEEEFTALMSEFDDITIEREVDPLEYDLQATLKCKISHSYVDLSASVDTNGVICGLRLWN